jgi:subtilisin family serine protease
MLMFFGYKSNAQSQFYLSEAWDEEGGVMPMFYRTSAVRDNNMNVYVVGTTMTDTSGFDILIQKFNSNGDLIWSQLYDGGIGQDDYGVNVFVDNSFNVHVTGGATQNTTDNLDLVVLKYNSSGALQWSYFYNFGGSPIPYDGGTAITGDNNGSIYVTGTSTGTTTMTDYVTIKLNSNNGNQIWTARYDFAQLNEVPTKIRISGSNIFVTGGSQSTQTPNIKWELATVRYNSSNGNQISVGRTSGNSSSGIDEAHDLTIDNNGNVYVVGATNNQNTGYDITILKFNDDLQLLWQQAFNGYGLEDKGYGIKTDAQGNVYAVGYITNPNQAKNYSILKYNSAGTLQWSREFNGLANQDDEAVQLVVRGDRIFVTGAARNGTYSDIVTMGYTADGQIFSVKSFESQFGLNDKPTAMGIDLDDNLIVVGQVQQTSGNFRNVTFKYNVHEKPIVPVYIDSVPAYNARELIVRFDKTAMNLDAVDKKNFDAGLLKDFVHEEVIDSLNAKFPFDAGRLQTFKIFRRMTTADSLSITRLGDTIPVPAFWATLSVMFPEEFDLFEAIDSLNTMKPMVHYGEVNLFISKSNIPDDPIYFPVQSGIPAQRSLHGASGFSTANINIEPAWVIETGSSDIIVGVFDSPIYWAHPDFYVDNNFPLGSLQGSKIIDGYDYYTSNPIGSITVPYDSHGTSVAGIIGAVRNNGVGIAGIAGGDYSVSNPIHENGGVKLISFGVLGGAIEATFGVGGLLTSSLAAIVEGAVLSTSGNYGVGVHIQNHSWTINETWETWASGNGNIEHPLALRDAIRAAWLNNSIVVASRGNLNNTLIRYPACLADEMVISVGASNQSGTKKSLTFIDDFVQPNSDGDANVGLLPWGSSYGANMDLLAPGITDLVASTHVLTSSPYPWESTTLQEMYNNNYGSGYSAFNGTSAAAPHVSGVAALMISTHNTANGAPNNLATEDVEQILQKTAYRAQNNLFYDDFDAWGLINAGLAVQQVDYPNYFVQHFSNNHNFKSITSTGQTTMILPVGNDFGVQPGTYIANRFLVTWNFNITLDNNHEIIDFWPLMVKSHPGFLLDTDYADIIELLEFPEVYPTINGNNITFSVQSYAYILLYNEEFPMIPLNIHLPYHPLGAEKMDYAFSLHVRFNEELSVSENNLKHIKAYPNPTNDILTLELSDITPQEIQIIDASGRIVHQLFLDANSLNHIEVPQFQELNTGLYFVKLISTVQESFTIKIIKK